MFPVRTSYQYNQRGDDEGTYTFYAAQNPPTGVLVDFYQKTAAKNPPKLEFLDEHGRVVRTYQGTHDVNGKQKPWVSNEVGINRFVWDWSTDGPVKWTGAAKKRYQGPDGGPLVPPGNYSARLTIGGRTFTQRFAIKADPRTQYTQAQIVRSYEFAKRGIAMYSLVDTMLNNLDTMQKSIDTATAAAKKANNTDATGKLDAIAAAKKDVFSFLTADYHNDEDSIERPGALREDIQTVQFFGGTVVTPGLEEYVNRAQTELNQGVAKYNDFVTKQLPALNDALKALNEKPVTITTVHN
jgi:hypothetical protein